MDFMEAFRNVESTLAFEEMTIKPMVKDNMEKFFNGEKTSDEIIKEYIQHFTSELTITLVD